MLRLAKHKPLAWWGLVFEVRAKHPVDIEKLRLQSDIDEGPVGEVRVYVADGPWRGKEVDSAAWRDIGSYVPAEPPADAEFALEPPLRVAEGEVVSFYVHGENIRSLACNREATAVEDDLIAVCAGPSSTYPEPFQEHGEQLGLPCGAIEVTIARRIPIQADARWDGSGLTITCTSMGGTLLDQFVAVDPAMRFSEFVDLVTERLPPAPATKWQLVLPSAECPGEERHEAAIGELFGLGAREIAHDTEEPAAAEEAVGERVQCAEEASCTA